MKKYSMLGLAGLFIGTCYAMDTISSELQRKVLYQACGISEDARISSWNGQKSFNTNMIHLIRDMQLLAYINESEVKQIKPSTFNRLISYPLATRRQYLSQNCTIFVESPLPLFRDLVKDEAKQIIITGALCALLGAVLTPKDCSQGIVVGFFSGATLRGGYSAHILFKEYEKPYQLTNRSLLSNERSRE